MSEPILKAEGMFMWLEHAAAKDGRRPVAGTLEVASDGTSSLTLTGLLPGDEPGGFVAKPIDPDRVIVGVLKDSRYVLLQRVASNRTTYGSAISHEEFRASDCILFRRLTEFPDIDAVSKVMVSFDSLGEWASEPAVKVTKTSRSATAHGIKPKTHTYRLADKALHLRTIISHPIPVDSWFREAKIKQETFLETVPKTPQNLEAVREDFHLLEDLILLLSDVDVALPWPTVWYGKLEGTYFFERRQTEGKKIEFLKSWAALTWVVKELGALLSNLRAQQDVLGPGLYLYLGIRRGRGLYLENEFSTAIFGLESLHRRVGTCPFQAKLEEKIARIIGDIKLKKDRDWLETRLANSGEPNLGERLFLTFSELDIGLDTATLRAFSSECAKLRNDVAHFGGQGNGDYDDFVQRMFTLNEVVRPLYHAVLLKRIGFEPDRIRAYFHRSPYAPKRQRMMKEAGLTFVTPPEQAEAVRRSTSPQCKAE